MSCAIVLLLLSLAVVNGDDEINCARCSLVSSPDQCHGTDKCDDDEVCYATQTDVMGVQVFSAGCGSPVTHCGGLLIHTDQQHHQCCYSFMCNRQLLQNMRLSPPTSVKPTSVKTTSVKTTTEAPSFVLQDGLKCNVCAGGDCGITGSDPIVQCPKGFPYCRSLVQNDVQGNKYITKRCAALEECIDHSTVSQSDANHAMCLNLDVAEVYQAQFECSYCCETGLCNKHIVPTQGTLVKGGVKYLVGQT